MKSKRAFTWAGYYLALSAVPTIVGLGMAGGGGYLVYRTYRDVGSVTTALGDSVGALALVAIGLVVWRLGQSWAFYKTLTAAVEDELSDTYDTEHVKADILSVLDDRLADMQLELQTMKGSLRDLQRESGEEADSGFEFND